MKVVVLVASLSAAMALDVSASPAQRDREPDRRPGAWVAAVRAHVPGQTDASLLRVAAWTPSEIARVLPSIAKEPGATRLLTKGLVLHTDIGILEQAGAITAAGEGVMTLQDGRASGNRRISLQWRIGRLVAAALADLPAEQRPGNLPPDRAIVERERRARLDVVRRWYRAVAALLQEEGHLGFAHTHVNGGLSVLGDDPVLLMYRATVRQAFADPRIQQFTRRRAGGAGAAFELDLAASDLRRALEVDPRLAEGSIRLAHVLADRGRYDDAAEILRPVMTRSLPPFLEYYGALVLGRAEERLGRVDDARAAFERAARLVPDAQVPRVALSRLALLDGRADAALAHLVDGSRGTEAEPSEDPWWWYFRRHVPDAREQVTALREAAR